MPVKRMKWRRMPEIIRVNPSHLDAYPTLKFPFDETPAIWVPERTVLRLDHGKRVPVFVWCYLERHVIAASNFYNPASLSVVRIAALPRAIERLAKHFRLRATSSRTIYSILSSLSRFLVYIDNDEHGGSFEPILSDPDVALRTLELYHRHLKSKIQTHASSRNTVANQELATLQALSIIHNRQYADELEKITSGLRRTTKAPNSEHVAQLMSIQTAIFDSACRILDSCASTHSDGTWRLSFSSSDESHVVDLPEGYSRARLMELAAMSYAGLVLCDSGANLAQLQLYEEPHDLSKQLTEPDRISLTQKVVKLRAGGKAVPLTMTAVTFTRLRRFAKIRHEIIELLGCDDIGPFFFKCEYANVLGRTAQSRLKIGAMEPIAVLPLSDYFAVELRKKIAAAGSNLPHITSRQLRSHKQQHLTRNYGLHVAAATMGHTIATAVKAYCAAEEGVQANDMGSFMSSLHKTVVRSAHVQSTMLVPVPAGECASHGNPAPTDSIPLVEPDCIKTEGCFFCERFRVHADEVDLRKLLSCRNVLVRIGHLQSESIRTDRVYESVLARIEFLLRELQQIMGSDAVDQIEADVAAGNLTRYWAVKVQQLGLLGLILTTAQS